MYMEYGKFQIYNLQLQSASMMSVKLKYLFPILNQNWALVILSRRNKNILERESKYVTELIFI